MLGSSQFQLKAAAIAFNFAGFFLYVTSAPALVTRHLQLGAQDFAWIFVPAVAGMFVGSLAANRMAGKLKLASQIAIGYGLMLSAALLNVGYHSAFPPAVPWTVLPLALYTCGMSVVSPGLTLLVLDLFPNFRGTVASCQAFTMTMLSAVVAGVVSPVLGQSALWLGAGQLGFGTAGFLLWRGGHWLGRKQRKESQVH